jgi:hypothetical protein
MDSANQAVQEYAKTTFERQFFAAEWDNDDNEMYNVAMTDDTPMVPMKATGCYSLSVTIDAQRRCNVSSISGNME